MELFQILTDVSTAIDTAGLAASSNLVDGNFSKQVLMYTTGLELAWGFALVILEDGTLGEGVAKAIRTTIIALLCLSAITSWQWVAKDIAQTSAAVVKQVGKGKELGSIVAGTLDQALQNTKPDQVYSNSGQQNADQSGWTGWLSKWSDLNFGTILDRIWAAELGLVNGAVVGIVAAISIFIILLGKLALWVGVIFGPLCLAFAPLKPTRKIAESWVSFTFASMMYPAVAAAVLILSGGIFDALAAMAQKASALNFPSTVYSIASLAIALVAGMVMLQVPKITQALFGGGIGVDAPDIPKPGIPKMPKSPAKK